MGKKKTTTVSSPTIDEKDISEILGECHDGEYLRVKMNDGSIKIVSKEELKSIK